MLFFCLQEFLRKLSRQRRYFRIKSNLLAPGPREPSFHVSFFSVLKYWEKSIADKRLNKHHRPVMRFSFTYAQKRLEMAWIYGGSKCFCHIVA